MTRRLYLAPSVVASANSNGEIDLPREQAHYLRSVLRLRKDDDVEIFTGDGRYNAASAIQISKQAVTLGLGPWSESPPPAQQLHLACAVLKNQAMDRVMQKATELGATHIHPLYTEHTQIPNAVRKNVETRNLHWQRIIENAAEQCGQNYLPRLEHPCELERFLARLPASQALALAIGAPPFPKALKAQHTLLLSGPEGGWSQQEIQQFQQHHVSTASIGNLVLRAETAPLAGLVSTQLAWR